MGKRDFGKRNNDSLNMYTYLSQVDKNILEVFLKLHALNSSVIQMTKHYMIPAKYMAGYKKEFCDVSI